MCVFLPCIHVIAKSFPNVEIDLLTKKRTCSKDFLDQDKYIHNIYYLPDEEGLKLNFLILKFFKKKKYENIFIMHYGLRYYLLSLLSGAKKIHFYGIFKKNESIVTKSRNSVTEWVKNTNFKFEPKIYLKKDYKKKLQITIGIGGSGYDKKWRIKNYQDLLNYILKKNSISRIVLAGGPSENDEAKLLSKNIEEKINAVKSYEFISEQDLDAIVSLAKFRGNQIGVDYAECFQVCKVIIEIEKEGFVFKGLWDDDKRRK